MKTQTISKNNTQSSKLMSFIAKNKIIVGLIIFALVGSLILWQTSASTSTRVSLLQAEKMQLNASSNAQKFKFGNNKQAIRIKSGTLSSSVNLNQESSKIVIRAKADTCKGSPVLGVTVGSNPEQFMTISSNSWKTYTLTQTNNPGTSTVKINIKNSYSNNKCTRSISVDYLDFRVSNKAIIPPVVPPTTPPSTTPEPMLDTTFNTTLGRYLPDTLYGVTIESVDNLSAIKSSLASHKKRPITRIVFQSGSSAPSYSNAVNNLRDSGYIMGEILDSTALKKSSVDSYKNRARDFVSTFGNKIDIYEIGNELNGSWVGQPADINAKVQAAYDVVEKEYASANLRSAVTLNYWPSSDCYSKSWEDTASFANGMPKEVKNGVDYVFLSFYETACSPRAFPTNQQFIDIFNKLKTTFPNAKIGMGEIGAQGKDDGFASNPDLSEKQRIANRYYGMHSALKSALGSRYVGGYFWWYYYQDAVPSNKVNSMWQTIENNFNSY